MTEIWNALLVHPLLSFLVLAYDFTRDFGLAIVLVTVGIRLILYPLFVTQIRSQRAMQEVGPALAELKAKHGKDRQRMAEEQMKLYRERGVNPAMGCLPLLVQLPILFAMYSAFIQAPDLTGEQLRGIIWPFIPNPLDSGERLDTSANWLPWIGECTRPDGAVLRGLACNDPIGILPILAGVTQLIASLMAQPSTMPKNLDPQAKMMQSMVYYFPVITIVIAWTLPSGLAVYWVATTVFQIVQQYFVTGWGQLTRWVPILRTIPTPADRSMARRESAAIAEVERDMAGDGAHGGTNNDTTASDTAERGSETRDDEGRRRGRRRRRR